MTQEKEHEDHFQRLFNFFIDEHGLILTQTEIFDVINEVKIYLENEK